MYVENITPNLYFFFVCNYISTFAMHFASVANNGFDISKIYHLLTLLKLIISPIMWAKALKSKY